MPNMVDNMWYALGLFFGLAIKGGLDENRANEMMIEIIKYICNCENNNESIDKLATEFWVCVNNEVSKTINEYMRVLKGEYN